MSSWSSRRKFAYGSIVMIIVIIFIGIPLFYLLYTSPTCFDNRQNGSESGIDCGGSCVKLCQNTFLFPQIAWGGAKYEKVAEGLYNVSAYIINQNINGAAIDVPYKFSLYDDKGVFITERTGKMTLYPHRNTLAFESAVDVGKRIPSKAIFEFIKAPIWFKSHDTLDGLAIIDKKYNEDENSSSLEVTLENKTLLPYSNLTVYVVLYDEKGNALGFSKTQIDNIDAENGREIASYTWPINRHGKVTSIEIIPSINPIVDR